MMMTSEIVCTTLGGGMLADGLCGAGDFESLQTADQSNNQANSGAWTSLL